MAAKMKEKKTNGKKKITITVLCSCLGVLIAAGAAAASGALASAASCAVFGAGASAPNAISFEGYTSATTLQLVNGVNEYDEDGTQMIDSPEKAYQAGTYFKMNDIDLCFIYLPNYVASGRWM